MLFFRYHLPHRDDSTTAWQRVQRGAGHRPYTEDHRGWQVVVTPRAVGITVRRRQYGAVMRHGQSGITHSLTGFPSLDAAREGARRWIDGQFIRQRVAAQRRHARLGRHRTLQVDQLRRLA